MTILQFSIFTISIFLITKSQTASLTKLPKLLVVSYDGYRYDFFNRKDACPYLKELKTRGIYADYMINAFTTKTFPNHFTMATGLYVENHGVVDSEFYDTKSGKKIKYSYDLFHYDNNTTPIWTLNEKAGHGRRSGVEMWAGGEFEYGGVKPTFSAPLDINAKFTDRIDEVISWFKHPSTPINFAMLYIDEPDFQGHFIGISNGRFNQMLRKVDEATRYLHTRLKVSGLSDVNVVHVSDHGMAPVTNRSIVDLNKYVDPNDYITAGYAPMMNIFPRHGKEEEVYANLQKAARETKGFDVYLKKDIPDRYHYRDNSRIGPIIVVNKVGYAFQTLRDDYGWVQKEFNITIDNDTEFGLHGYDNSAPEMHPIFFGVGPAFLPKCKIDPPHNVDLVPLFCDILEIPQPHVDGTLSPFKKCLSKYHT